MRRLVAATAAVGVLFGSAVAVAAAGTTLTGTAEWTSQVDQVAGLQSTTTTIEGTFGNRLGKGTYAGTLTGGAPFFTSTCGPVCESVTGTITFTTSHGSFTTEVQPDGVVQLEDIASHSWRTFTLSLAVVSGTGSYAHASGTLSLSYVSTWEHEVVDGVFVSVITDSGTLTGNSRRPVT